MFVASLASAADLRLASVFGDHMVLQREKPVAIWGRGEPGGSVTIRFAGQEKTVTAREDGTWLARLEPMPASHEPRELVVTGNGQTRKCTDVLMGEVWLLGGQSNMEMPLWWRGDGKRNADGTRLVQDTDHPWLRCLLMPQRAFASRQEGFPQDTRRGEANAGQWFASRSSDPNISSFSALGYFIALGLHEKLGVPIGMVDASWGGTIASAWVDRETLNGIPEAAALIKARESAASDWSEEKARLQLDRELADWERRVAIAKAEKKGIPGKPQLRTDPRLDRNFPSGPFNGMIWPLRNMAVRGVFFYQGENNYFDQVDPFERTYPAVVTSWRKTFSEPDLPFCLFQICGWENKDMLYRQTKLPILQEQQHRAHLSLPRTGFVVTTDYPHTDIHPMRKRPIAERAIRWAAAEVYGDKKTTWGTPSFQSMRREGKRLILEFSMVGNERLELKKDPAGFVISEKGGKFLEAKAEILDAKTVAVWNDTVARPWAVRYAWSQRAICGLYTSSGLPVGPFRTDTGPIPPKEIED